MFHQSYPRDGQAGKIAHFGRGRSMIRRRAMLEGPYHRPLYEPHPSAQLPPKAFVGLERAQFQRPSTLLPRFHSGYPRTSDKREPYREVAAAAARHQTSNLGVGASNPSERAGITALISAGWTRSKIFLSRLLGFDRHSSPRAENYRSGPLHRTAARRVQ